MPMGFLDGSYLVKDCKCVLQPRKALALGGRGRTVKPGVWGCMGSTSNPDFGIAWLWALKHTLSFQGSSQITRVE